MIEKLSKSGSIIWERYEELLKNGLSSCDIGFEVIEAVIKTSEIFQSDTRRSIFKRVLGADDDYLLGFNDGYRAIESNTLETSLVMNEDEKLIGFRDGVSIYRLAHDLQLEVKFFNSNS